MSSFSSVQSIEKAEEDNDQIPIRKWLPLTRRKSFHSLQIIDDNVSEKSFDYSTLRLEFPESPLETRTSLYEQLLSALLEKNNDEEHYENVSKHGNIILDMDGTLGDCIPSGFAENPERFCGNKPIPRPGLRTFFRFVFSHFERVSIWTAASPLWYGYFKNNVLLPNMPTGAKFHFEKTRNMKEPYIVLKPLRKIYELYPEYTPENTIIVDDNIETFADNCENAVHIPSFFYDNFGGSPLTRRRNAINDRGLFTIIEVLQGHIQKHNR